MRVRLMSSVFLLLLFLASDALGCSVVEVRIPLEVPRNVVIHLKHRDATVSNVQLFLRDKAGQALRSVTTDENGRAEFFDLPEGEYSITSEVSDDVITSTGAKGITDLTFFAHVPSKPISLASLEGTVTDKTGAVITNAIAVV